MASGPEMIDEIEDVNVYLEKNGSRYETDLRTVRDEYYGGIDELLERNTYGSRGMGTGSMGRSNDNNSTKANQDYEDWLESIEDIDVEMDIKTSTGVVTVQVEPRTDFGLGDIQTSPNVMKVKHNGATQYAIREWSHYLEAGDDELEDRVNQLAWGEGAEPGREGYSRRAHINYERKPHDELGTGPKTFNMGSTDVLSRLSSNGKHFNRNSHDDELYEAMGTPGFDPEDYDDGILMIPELMLETAMHRTGGIEEQLENNELASPVTPSNVKLLDLYDDMAFVIRPWGNNATDGGIYGSEEDWGTFYGTMEGLGLVSPFDRKDEFIEETMPGGETRIKFFDPEFTAYTEKDSWFMGADWDNFVRVPLQEHANARTKSIEQVKSRKNRVADSFNDRIQLLDEIPDSIDRDLFPREKIIETRV